MTDLDELSFGQNVGVKGPGGMFGQIRAEIYGYSDEGRPVYTLTLRVACGPRAIAVYYYVPPRYLRHARAMVWWWLRRHPQWALTHA